MTGGIQYLRPSRKNYSPSTMKKICFSLVLATSIAASFTSCDSPGGTEALGHTFDILGDMSNNPNASIGWHNLARLTYAISDIQQREAERKARAAMRDAEFRRRLAAKNTRYVAVPVKPSDDQEKSKAKNMVVLYDTEKETTVGDAYVPKKSHYAEGEEASFGGRKAVVASSFTGF